MAAAGDFAASANPARTSTSAPGAAPAGLVGAALVLWGLSIGLPWLGAIAGLGFEALRRLAASGRGAQADSAASAASAASARADPPALRDASAWTTPLVRGCAITAAVSLTALLAVQGAPQALYSWLRWLPLVCLPLPLLQCIAGRLTAGDLRRALQRRPAAAARPAEAPPRDAALDLTHLHAALTLAAAGTGTGAQRWLYPAFVCIVGWALLARLPRRPLAQRAAAAALVALAAGIGWAVHVGTAALQGQVEEWSTDLIADWLAPPADPFRERTRIGDLGQVKLSDRIVMRVSAEQPPNGPLLLRESVFDRYRGGEWQTARRATRPAARQGDGWRLGKANASSDDGNGGGEGIGAAAAAVATHITVRRSLPGGQGLLPLPLGTRHVAALPADTVDVLATGTVRARGTPRFVAMRVAYDEAGAREAPDAATDLEVPQQLGEMLARVIEAERLRQPSPAATAAAVRAFFEEKFAYSLTLERVGGGSSSGAAGGAGARTLADFLLHERRGHCEYFATATVLLLRQAGVPARYVGGYSVSEYSQREQAYLVRARHAHAWAQAWLNERWVNVDTTPARWAEFEQAAARSAFAALLDLLSWLADRALRAWQDFATAGWQGVAGALLAAAALLAASVVFVRLAMRRRRARRAAATAPMLDDVARAWSGVEQRAAQLGHGRDSRETAQAWVQRLHAAADSPPWQGDLADLVRRYYRVRFDPAAGAEDARAFLAAALRWVSAPSVRSDPANAGLPGKT